MSNKNPTTKRRLLRYISVNILQYSDVYVCQKNVSWCLGKLSRASNAKNRKRAEMKSVRIKSAAAELTA